MNNEQYESVRVIPKSVVGIVLRILIKNNHHGNYTPH